MFDMTTAQKRKLLQRISTLEADISTLKATRTEIAANGYASATMASGGGSRSYTRLDLDKITQAITALQTELKQCRALLAGNAN